METPIKIPENLHYTIDFLSNEWIINNVFSLIVIISFIYIGFLLKKYKSSNIEGIFTFLIGILMATRIIGRHLYDIYAFEPTRWNIEWSLPLHLCNISCIVSCILFIILI